MARIHAFRAGTPNLNRIENIPEFFDTCKSSYREYYEENLFDQDRKEALYLYQIDKGTEKQTGLLCTLDLNDYIEGQVVPHEKTLAAKRKHMQHLFEERQAHIKPAMLTFPARDAIKELMINTRESADLIYQTQYQQEIHRVWRVDHPKTIRQFEKLFQEQIPKTYIADGHHRTEASSELFLEDLHLRPKSKLQYLLVALFSSDQLQIHEFHRIIYSFNGLSKKQLLKAIEQSFSIEPSKKPVRPKKKHRIGLFIGNEWYILKAKRSILQSGPSGIVLDVHLVNRYILSDVLNIHDVSHDNRVQYLEGPKGLKALEKKVRKESEAFGLTLFPIDFEAFRQVVDAGELLPPKSTYFEPRMRNGFITQRIE
ncbi:MAG: DUF1015 domain-containing protein [Bacteroidota bacterium]